MKLTDFKKQLKQRGTKIEHWEGVDKQEVTEFLSESQVAQELYEQELKLDNALDHYMIEESTVSIVDHSLAKIKGESAPDATVHNIKKQRSEKGRRLRPFLWSGVAAIAACAMLFIGSVKTPHQVTTDVSANTKLASVAINDEVNELIENSMNQVIQQQEVIGLFHLANTNVDMQKQKEIDTFLDELFSDEEEQETLDEGSNNDSDLWGLFMAIETEQL